jgi:regulator of protease activity HflC (stomatin/prohibitin superfamily)
MINKRLTQELSEMFLEQSNQMLNVTEVQLRKIELEADLESAVEDKLIELQSQRKWQIQQNITLIVKETELIRQKAENNITIIYANATAIATDVRIKAEANATKLEYEGYAVAFKSLINSMSAMSDDTALLSFMFAESISKYTHNANLNLGFNKPNTLITSGGK